MSGWIEDHVKQRESRYRVHKMIRRFKEHYAIALLVLAFFSGMLLTAITSGCDSRRVEPVLSSDSLK
jgi:hypothetical protein